MNEGRILPGDHLTAAEVAARHRMPPEVAGSALGILADGGRLAADGTGYVVTGRPEGDPDTAPFPADEFTYRVVADRLATRIKAGEFGELGKLPGSTAIARHYGVGPGVVRHARQELIARGLACWVPGSGTFTT